MCSMFSKCSKYRCCQNNFFGGGGGEYSSTSVEHIVKGERLKAVVYNAKSPSQVTQFDYCFKIHNVRNVTNCIMLPAHVEIFTLSISHGTKGFYVIISRAQFLFKRKVYPFPYFCLFLMASSLSGACKVLCTLMYFDIQSGPKNVYTLYSLTL